MKLNGDKPKILFFDLETAPNTAYIWGLWTETKSMDFVTNNWYVLCWAAKWLDEKGIQSAALRSKGENDKAIVQKLWKLLDEADIVIAHNALKFDHRRINTRFLIHGIKPPSPYKIIDTLKDARRHFDFTSNRLGDLGVLLKVGEKIHTEFELWKQCMAGDKKAWDTMIKYCIQDVYLLEQVYLKLRPYINNHPNIGAIKNEKCCPKCGEQNIQYRGYSMTAAGRYRRFQCMTCGGWGKDSKKIQGVTTLRNAQ